MRRKLECIRQKHHTREVNTALDLREDLLASHDHEVTDEHVPSGVWLDQLLRVLVDLLPEHSFFSLLEYNSVNADNNLKHGLQ